MQADCEYSAAESMCCHLGRNKAKRLERRAPSLYLSRTLSNTAVHQLDCCTSLRLGVEPLKHHSVPCAIYTRFPSALYMLMTLVTLVSGAQAAGRCYVNGPGTSIAGADYRRDYEVSLKDCAGTCREDVCCMAFEWVDDGTCTLKSRSLNGTVEKVHGVHFGFCLDSNDVDRNHLWDHEIHGPETGFASSIDREECSDYCSTLPETQMFSWKSSNPKNMDEPIGDCTCIKELNRILLNFGSFAGVVV